MENTLFYLSGYPGTGKLTVAKELCRAPDTKLVDNHLTCNTIFALLPNDGKSPMPEQVWGYIERVRNVVYEALVNMAPRNMNYVLTGCPYAELPQDREWAEKIKAMAEGRNAMFVPVTLVCDEVVNADRIRSESRRERMKMTDAAMLSEFRAKYTLLKFGHPHEMELDISTLSPQQSAEAILAHARQLREVSR